MTTLATTTPVAGALPTAAIASIAAIARAGRVDMGDESIDSTDGDATTTTATTVAPIASLIIIIESASAGTATAAEPDTVFRKTVEIAAWCRSASPITLAATAGSTGRTIHAI